MAASILLICAASTPSARSGGFSDSGEAIDVRGARDAAALRLPSRFGGALWCSPWTSAVQTAAAWGAATEAAALADRDAGRWRGMGFEEIEAAEPGALPRWIADPASAPPGGESMADAAARIGLWLDGMAAREETACAVTHPTMIRAAMIHAIGLSADAAFAIDLAPLSGALLSFNRQWRLQALGPAAGWASGL